MKLPALDTAACDHLCKLLGMLGSKHDGERASAGLKAHEYLQKLGLSWRDVIVAPALVPSEQPDNDDDELPNWRRMLDVCLAAREVLPNRDANFILNLSRWRRPPSEKQRVWLRDHLSASDVMTAALVFQFLKIRCFAVLCQAAAQEYVLGHVDLIDTVDRLQDYAMGCGLVAEIGQDAVQELISRSFAPVRRQERNCPPTASREQNLPGLES